MSVIVDDYLYGSGRRRSRRRIEAEVEKNKSNARCLYTLVIAVADHAEEVIIDHNIGVRAIRILLNPARIDLLESPC